MAKPAFEMKLDTDKLEKSLKHLERDLMRSMWVPTKRMAEKVEREIRDRVLKGRAGLTGGYNLKGGAIADNDPKTIWRKIRKRRVGPAGVRSLYDTGELFGAWEMKVDKDRENPSTTISLPESRREIVGYLAATDRKIRYVDWFGWPVAIKGKATYNVFTEELRRYATGVLKRIARRGLVK